MPAPTSSVGPGAGAATADRNSSPSDGAFTKGLIEPTRAEDEVSESGSESTMTAACTMSQGLDNWSMADASWSPGDLRGDGDISPTSPKRAEGIQGRRPSVVKEEEGESAAADDGADSGTTFRVPPGLEDAAPQALSRGSGMHNSGDCSPCVWHWKPQGCFRGQDCGYCHLCPEGEIKTRKKAKLATLRSGSSRGLECADEKAQQAGEETPTQGTQGLPSVGSAMHGSGECRPCAWFWKPQGCQNGQECRHCHLCPEGEIKLRKKMKMETIRKDREEEEEDIQQQEDLQEPMKVVLSADDMAFPPPPGLAEPVSLTVPSMDTAPSPAVSLTYTETKTKKKERAKATHQEQWPEPERFGMGESLLPGCLSPTSPLSLPLLAPMLPSIGSSLHGTGMCRPCAWFWKPQGCQNGQECCHCHLCPSGEIKARRKMKVAVLRHQGSMQEELEMQQEEMGQWEAQWEAQQQSMGAFFMGQEAVTAEEAALAGEASPSPQADSLGSQSPFALPVPLDLAASLETPLPSTGSALHALGKCRPCAWFWKEKGCLNGQACAHCHLCPEGELKSRKKVKETAMRMGALMPARRNLDARSPRVVKIAPVLGA